jgi:hypothetical protein
MKSITFPILLPFTTCSYKTLIFLDVPNGQPSVLADSKDLADRTVVLPLVSVDVGDRVLMNSLQLARSGLSRSSAQTASTPPRGRGRRLTPGIRLLESVERDRVQSSDATFRTSGTRSLGSQRLGRVRVVEGLGHHPSVGSSLEEDGLTIVSGRDERGLGQEAERDVRERDGPDGLDGRRGFARSSRVNDGDRSVVAFRTTVVSVRVHEISVYRIESSYSLAKAKASPEGEKATSCTHPPFGLLNSPQTVLKGNFSPQADG